jgi:starch synthase
MLKYPIIYTMEIKNIKRYTISLFHPIKNSNAVHAAQAFEKNGMLGNVYTSYYYKQSLFLKLVKKLSLKAFSALDVELQRRDWKVNPSYIKTFPFNEFLRIFLLKSTLAKRLNMSHQKLNDWVYETFDKKVSKQKLGKINAVYAYEDAAQRIFETAKGKKITCMYELPIAHYSLLKSILTEEAKLFPEFAPSLISLNEPTWKLRKKDAELKLADLIFVPSDFVKQSIIDATDILPDKIRINPYGAPVESFYPAAKKDETFRILFVGAVGPRKGVHYLIQAWKELNLPISELLLVGKNVYPEDWLEKAIHGLSIRYIPSVPHHTLKDIYTSSDAFVFPSLAEGLALVQLEALSCGLPVITTANAGASSIIQDGYNGFIIPIRDIEAIKQKIMFLYNTRSELLEMKRQARLSAETYSWQRYQKQLIDDISKFVNAE